MFLFMFLIGFTSFIVLLICFSSIPFVESFWYCAIYCLISNNPSANVLVFRDVHHKDRQTYSYRTDTSGESSYNFFYSQQP